MGKEGKTGFLCFQLCFIKSHIFGPHTYYIYSLTMTCRHDMSDIEVIYNATCIDRRCVFSRIALTKLLKKQLGEF